VLRSNSSLAQLTPQKRPQDPNLDGSGNPSNSATMGHLSKAYSWLRKAKRFLLI
jgi:hypothetical protein